MTAMSKGYYSMIKSSVIVAGHREVSIECIHQWPTYRGLLEGLPTTQMNACILSRSKQYARKYCDIEAFHLLEPVQTAIKYEGKYPLGNPSALPPITCLAALWSLQPVRDKTKDAARLAVTWFQNEFAFPIDAAVLEQMKGIPFDRIAEDFEY